METWRDIYLRRGTIKSIEWLSESEEMHLEPLDYLIYNLLSCLPVWRGRVNEIVKQAIRIIIGIVSAAVGTSMLADSLESNRAITGLAPIVMGLGIAFCIIGTVVLVHGVKDSFSGTKS